MMQTYRFTLAAVALVLGLVAPAFVVAQEPGAGRPTGQFAALEALYTSYEKQLHDLECRRIADLAALAEKSPGPEADAAYVQLFSLAIARNLCPQALEAASRCLANASAGHDTRSLAALVRSLARADQGEHDRALAELKELFHESAGGAPAAQKADLALAVGEAFLQRLIRDGRYDVARKLCELACEENAHASLKDHFEDRMARLDVVGKPAPPIAGTDVDGKPVSLSDLKGMVVLVDFWATWCPPCVAAVPALSALAHKYHDRGFEILGINVDAMHENVKEAAAAQQVVRRFLVEHRVPWTNLVNGRGAGDFAAAYQVEQIPASFLVGRDGKVVAVELTGEVLERAVVNALGGSKPGRTQ